MHNFLQMLTSLVIDHKKKSFLSFIYVLCTHMSQLHNKRLVSSKKNDVLYKEQLIMHIML